MLPGVRRGSHLAGPSAPGQGPDRTGHRRGWDKPQQRQMIPNTLPGSLGGPVTSLGLVFPFCGVPALRRPCGGCRDTHIEVLFQLILRQSQLVTASAPEPAESATLGSAGSPGGPAPPPLRGPPRDFGSGPRKDAQVPRGPVLL